MLVKWKISRFRFYTVIIYGFRLPFFVPPRAIVDIILAIARGDRTSFCPTIVWAIAFLAHLFRSIHPNYSTLYTHLAIVQIRWKSEYIQPFQPTFSPAPKASQNTCSNTYPYPFAIIPRQYVANVDYNF